MSETQEVPGQFLKKCSNCGATIAQNKYGGWFAPGVVAAGGGSYAHLCTGSMVKLHKVN